MVYAKKETIDGSQLREGDIIRHVDGVWRVLTVDQIRLNGNGHDSPLYTLEHIETGSIQSGTLKEIVAFLREGDRR